MSGRSGVIARIRLPEPLEELRLRHDPMAAEGVPAHVTLLFPFLATEDLTPAVRRRLARIASGVRPFSVRFDATGRFPGVLWVAPEPAGPFVELTERLAAAFPDHPPYGGAHDDVIPHLTIGLAPEATLGRIERKAGPDLGFRDRVRALEVIAEDGTGRWHARWRLPLGRLRR